MPDNKQYHIFVPGASKAQNIDSETFNQKREQFFHEFPDAEVVETEDFVPGKSQIDNNSQYEVFVEGMSKPQYLSAEQFASGADSFFNDYPNAKVRRIRQDNYWGDKLTEIYDRIGSLEDQLKGPVVAGRDEEGNYIETQYSAQSSAASLRNMDDDQLMVEAARVAPESVRRRKINQEIEQLKAERDNNPAWKKYLREQVSDMEESLGRVEQMKKEAKTRVREGDTQSLMDEEILNAAKNLYSDARETAAAPSRSGDKVSDAWAGIRDTGLDFISLVATAKALGNINLIEAVQMIQKREGDKADIVDLVKNHSDELSYLSKPQKELMRAFVRKSEIESLRADNISRWYQAGQGFAKSLGFMGDFLLAGGLAEGAANKIVGETVAQAAGAAGKTTLRKIGAETLQGFVKAAVMTPLMPSTYSNVIDSITRLNNEGGVDLSGKAVLSAFGDAFIETVSETIGSEPLKLLGWGIGKALPTDWIGKTKLGAWGKALRHTPVFNSLKQAGWNGFVEEMFEEVSGNQLRVWTGIDRDAQREFLKPDQLLITAASFAPMSLLGGLPSTAQFIRSSNKMTDAQEELKMILASSGMSKEEMKAAFDSMRDAETPEQLGTRVAASYNTAVKNGADPERAFNAAQNYAEAAARYKVLEGIYAGQKDIDRSKRAAEITKQLGSDRWYHEGVDKERYVRTLTDENGGVYYVTGDADDQFATIDPEGKLHFVFKSVVDGGNWTDSGEVPINTYLDGEVRQQKSAEEQQRMDQEQRDASNQLAELAFIGKNDLQIGTAEQPATGTILAFQGGQYIVQSNEDGSIHNYTPEQMGMMVGVNMTPKTDEQIEQEQVAEMELSEENRDKINAALANDIIDLDGFRNGIPGGSVASHVIKMDDGTYRLAYLDPSGQEQITDISNSELAELATRADVVLSQSTAEMAEQGTTVEKEQPAGETEHELPAELSPEEETNLWNEDPAKWAAWNDRNRQDGGADSISYIQAAANAVQGAVNKAQKQYAKELDFGKRRQLADEVAKQTQRLKLLNDILADYQRRAEAAQRAELARQKAAEAEKNAPRTPVELAAAFFKNLAQTGNLKNQLNREDFARELGWGDEELQKFFYWWKGKGQGRTLMSLAEEMANDFDSYGIIPMDSNADIKDTQVARDAIIELLRSSNIPSEATNFIENERAREEEDQRASEETDAQTVEIPDGSVLPSGMEDVRPVGKNGFGNIFDQFKGKIKEAFDFLLSKKEGYLKGVFHRDDIGDIDLTWGAAPTRYTGYGLSHIIKKHIDTLGDFKDVDEAEAIIDDVIRNGSAAEDPKDPTRVNIEKGNYRVTIVKGEEGNWILTAFDFVTPASKKKEEKEKEDTAAIITPGQSNEGAGAVAPNLPIPESRNSSSDGLMQDSASPSTPVAPSDNSTSVSDNKGSEISGETSTPGENLSQGALDFNEEIEQARQDVDTNPSDAQKEAGNYKKGHVTIDGYDISIENPKGSVRSGTDADGNPWSVTMNNDYGYIRMTEGVDGDHIDVFLSDNPTDGNVFVVDQVNPQTGEFDEHKVMYGFPDAESARTAYLANYSPGWKGLGTITEVSKDEFKKWIDSSHRKTKPFSEYKSVKPEGAQNEAIARPSAVPYHPDNLRKAYESGDAAKIAEAEKAMADYINSSTSITLLKGSERQAKNRRLTATKGSPEYKTQDFVAKTAAMRMKELDKILPKVNGLTASKAYDAARKTYGDRWNASVDELRQTIAYYEMELTTAQQELAATGVSNDENTEDMYVLGLRGRVAMATTFLNGLNAELRAKTVELTEAQAKSLAFVSGKTEEQIREEQEQHRQQPLKDRVKQWEERTGQSITVYSSIDEIPSEEVAARVQIRLGQKVAGWFSPATNRVAIYLPNTDDVTEVDKTYMHEIVSHKGLRELLGENGFNELMVHVWNDVMTDADRKKWRDYNSHLTGTEEYLRRAAADEYVANLAENIDTNPTAWEKIVAKVKEILNKLGIDLKITDADLRTMLQASLARYEALKREAREQQRAQMEAQQQRNEDAAAFVAGERTKASDTAAAENNPQVPISETQEKYEDFGEKIGWAKKDLAKRGYSQKKNEGDARPAWRKKYEAANITELSESDKAMARRMGLRTDFTLVPKDILAKGPDYSKPFVGYYVQKSKSKYGRDRTRFITDETRKPIIFTSEDQYEATIPVFEAKDQGYRVRQDGNKFKIVRPASNGKMVEYAEFDSREDAVAYLASPEGCTDLLNRKRENYELPALEELTRNNMPDYRNGRNITPDDFQKMFKFRGGEFGNWVNAAERQQALNYAYDALMDLAMVLGVTPESLSLNGELSIAIGARGEGGARAHYEPTKAVINLTKMKGAGSLAHEWAHALDNYFGLMDAKQTRNREEDVPENALFLSEGWNWKKGARQEVRDAFSAVMKAIKEKTVTRQIALDKAQKDYDDMVGYARRQLMNQYREQFARGLTRYQYNRKTKERDVVKIVPTEEQLAEYDRLAALLETDPTFKFDWDYKKAAYRASGDVASQLYELVKDVMPNRGGEKYGPLHNVFYYLEKAQPLRERLEKAKAGETETVSIPTTVMEDSKWFDRMRAGEYYAKDIEMFARAFENYVSGEMRGEGQSSDYLTYEKGPLYQEIWDHNPYPAGEERAAVKMAFDHLFDVLQEKVDEQTGRTMLFRKDGFAAREGNVYFRKSRSLVGMHNISENKLAKAMKTGGLANPSAAVVDIARQNHEDYGEISLIMPSSLVDSETGRNIGTFLGDAWTPTYPGTQKIISDAGWDKLFADLRALPDEVRSKIRLDYDLYLEDDRMADSLKWWFLHDTGRNPEIVKHESGLPEATRDFILSLGDRGDEAIENDREAFDRVADLFRQMSSEEEIKKAETKMEPREGASEIVKRRIERRNAGIDKYGIAPAHIAQFFNQLHGQLRREGSVNEYETFDRAARFVESENLQDEFQEWLDAKDERYDAETKLFAGWTKDGEKKWLANTVENASRLMNGEPQQNSYSNGGLSATRANLAQRMRTLADIRRHKDLLVSPEEYDERYKELEDELFAAIQNLADRQKLSDNVFSNIDYAEARLQEALPMRSPAAYLNAEYGYSIPVNGEYAESLKQLKKDLRAMPAQYFETKFGRPVMLDEFAAAVVPSDIKEETRKTLTDAGLPLFEYDPKESGSRREATMKATEGDNILFRKAYHGSGASFDRFDHSHMGEGEGAQAHGWGTYISFNEDTARGYAERSGRSMGYGDRMAIRESIRRLVEQRDEIKKSLHQSAERHANWAKSHPDASPEEMKAHDDLALKLSLGDVPFYQAIESAIRQRELLVNSMEYAVTYKHADMHTPLEEMETIADAVFMINHLGKADRETFLDYYRYDMEHSPEGSNLRKVYDFVSSTTDEDWTSNRNFYTVEIPEDTGLNYMDEQADAKLTDVAEVWEALSQVAEDDVAVYLNLPEFHEFNHEHTGKSNEYLYQNLARILGSQKEASKLLERIGYAGIKYDGRIDGPCAVIFNDQDVKITDHIRFRKAPNGAESNLNEEQYDAVRTPQFKQWFGNWDIAAAITPVHKSKGTFKNFDEAEDWAKNNLQGKTFTNKYTGEDISISGKSITEMLAPKFTKAVSEDLHKAALMSVPEFIETGIPAETHPDYHGKGYDVLRLYNAIEIDGKVYRVKSTVKKLKAGDRYYTYELQKMEVVEGTQSPAVGLDGKPVPSSNTSISGANLLKDVKKTNSDDNILNYSKVVDENGEPRVVEHATNADFTVFDISHLGENSHDKGLFGAGFYFGSRVPGWLGGSKNLMRVYLNIRKPFETIDGGSELGDIYNHIVNKFDTPALRKLILTQNGKSIKLGDYIDIVKSVDDEIAQGLHNDTISQDEDLQFYAPKDRIGVYRERLISSRAGEFGVLPSSMGYIIGEAIGSENFSDALIKDGYDGAIVNRGSDYKEYVVFEPNQIKSATENNGDYSNENPDIRFRRANEDQPIFISNAEKGVSDLKMDKATPEQWKKTLEKNGGLKAAEDKWLGLSMWLDGLDRKTVTKQEVLDFIQENQIQIEEQHYADAAEAGYAGAIESYRNEYRRLVEETGGYDAAFDAMIDRYGDDFDMAFERDGDSISLQESWAGNGFTGAAEYYLDQRRENRDTRAINPTRLDYTTEGLTNKREIALTVPTIAPWNEGDDVHFGDAGEGRAIAWARFGDTYGVPDSIDKERLQDYGRMKNLAELDRDRAQEKIDRGTTGRTREQAELDLIAAEQRLERLRNDFADVSGIQNSKVLVIDEIQSKRHQEGREKGYAPKDQFDGATVGEYEVKPLERGRARGFNAKQAPIISKDGREIGTMVDKDGWFYIIYPNGSETSAFPTAEKILEVAKQTGNKNAVYPAPFEKNWHELAMKRMLRLAAEEGYDYVAWTTGEQQADRYSLSSVIDRIEVVQHHDGTGERDVYLDKPGDREIELHVNKDGKVVSVGNRNDNAFVGNSLADIIGKELAVKAMTVKTDKVGNAETIAEGEQLRIGGEGMKGFYDDILPRFMNKYGKQWGVKVEDIYLPNVAGEASAGLPEGLTMHAVPVTPEMKESVMQGQLMFRRAEETPADIAADLVNRYDNQDGEEYPWMSEGELIEEIENTLPYEAVTEDIFASIDRYRRMDDADFEEGRRDFTGGEMSELFDDIVGQLRELAESRNREGGRYSPSPVSYSESTGAKRLAANRIADACGIEIEFKPSTEMQENGKALAGRWVNGKMFVCPEHCRDAEDAIRTVLHEGVGHNGLRRLVGDENMRAFCIDVYRRLPESARKEIADAAVRKYGANVAHATEEYLAREAETIDYSDQQERSFWDTVRDALRKVLAKIGIDVPLSERDIRWLMWQSYNANKQSDILNFAKRQVVANRLGFTLRQEEYDQDGIDTARNREAVDAEISGASRAYNFAAQNVWKRLKESFVDQYTAINDLVSAIEKESGRKAASFEDIRLALNQQGSKALAKMNDWIARFNTPMWDEIKAVMKKAGCDLSAVERYVMLKHGLERNEVFAKRDARAVYQSIHDNAVKKIQESDHEQYVKDEEIAREDAKLDRHFRAIENGTDKYYQEYRERDYGGLTGLYSEFDDVEPKRKGETAEEFAAREMAARHPMYDNVADMEAAARDEVADFERKADTSELWKRINAATKETLRQQYEANIISRGQYTHVRDMFQYYVPLRGFSDKTAEDLYDYYNSDQRGVFTAPLQRAGGRTTKAESPFGFIAAAASSGIAQDMKNESKLALYYFISNRKGNDLVSVSEQWYEKVGEDEEGKAIFEPVYPPFNEDLSSEQSKRSFEDWEKTMREKARSGLAFKGRGKLDLSKMVVYINPESKKDHVIAFKLGGKDMMMYINGNPRAAQAINNELNYNAENNVLTETLNQALRVMAALNTQLNPEFWISNFQRDALFALMSVSTKEGGQYAKDFGRNLAAARKVVKMKKAFEKGTLGDSHDEQLYREFVENGGVTGYTVVYDNEYWEKRLDEYAGKDKNLVAKAIDALKGISEFGEAVEQMTRFAAFKTSREAGKDIKQSVADAKELTVNFNRKGSGKAISLKEAEKLTWANGRALNKVEQLLVSFISNLSPYGRRFIMFFNASIQGLNAMVQLFKKNPDRAAMWCGGYLAVGMINAILHALMDDDDDYLDIPDWERRNNLLLGVHGWYLKWALPQEARVFYGLGDMIVNHAMGRTPNKNIIGELLSSLGEVAPIDFPSGVGALAPSAAIPIVDIIRNKDYKGARVYNEHKYYSEEERRNVPAYRDPLANTGGFYVSLSKVLNAMTGGDEYQAGMINWNPNIIEHLVEGYTGGTGTSVEKLFQFFGDIAGGDVVVRNTPFLRRVLSVNDERYRNTHTTELYYYYQDQASSTSRQIKEASKAGDDKKLDKLRNSRDYAEMQIFDSYKGLLKYYNDELRLTDNPEERKALMREQDAIRKEMIQEISNIGKE